MTISDREVIEALRDEPELLAIADAVHSARERLLLDAAFAPARRRLQIRASRAPLVAVALALAAALAVVLASPWGRGGGPSFVEQALAAVGDRPVLHVVIRFQAGERIDLRTGHVTRQYRDGEFWYDAERGLVRSVVRVDGRIVHRSNGTVNRETAAYLSAPYHYAELYRAALRQGALHRIGTGFVRGHTVVLLEGRGLGGTVMRVGVDKRSLQLLRLQFLRGGHQVAQLDVLQLQTVSRQQANPATPVLGASTQPPSMRASTTPVALEDVRSLFRLPPLWFGRTVSGHRLTGLRLETVTTTKGGRTVHRRLLRLDYAARSESKSHLGIEEAPAASAATPFALTGDYPPPAGYLDLPNQQEGLIQKGGFVLRLTASNRQTLIAAARTLRPVPAATR